MFIYKRFCIKNILQNICIQISKVFVFDNLKLFVFQIHSIVFEPMSDTYLLLDCIVLFYGVFFVCCCDTICLLYRVTYWLVYFLYFFP